MASTSLRVKLGDRVDAISNGAIKSVNGGAPVKVDSATSRKERRKDWWSKKKKGGNKMSSPPAKEKEKAPPPLVAEDNTVEGDQESAQGSESLRKKLRNRETIAKPDSLKYEPDLNRGFHSKIIQNLYVDTRRKKKKGGGGGGGGEKPLQTDSGEAVKRKSDTAENQQQQQPQQQVKKAKAAVVEDSQVFDSYTFSLSLINGQIDTSANEANKDSKKYVLFVGNLPYDVTKEQLEEHFRKTGGIKSIRIPKERGSDRGRGFAYMEFDGRISHGIALRLHQTTLGGRKINVEFTSIGGGSSDTRREKLKQKNQKRRRMKMH
ncbi:uncharacterized RNA-binding protein C365.04c [Aplysia californica]|uniref:Uncharacterized RNA-binding protein C365.04c n=1 Tax=Aplysia californica TaxID=6500 RepID=A0ABM0KAL6_APLCA|nr:uncharacterized RNA-binding protein C365.04c [Aplysia californica]